jgi:LacI family transcriptional regulator
VNIPLVFFDRQFEGLGLPNITYDDRNGAVIALEKIIKEGYTKIAHAAGYFNISIGKERCLGYKEALTKNGIKINPEWIIEGGFEVNDGYNSFMKLYKSGNLPEIILAVNDRVALGIYQAAKEKKVRIPEDMGVVAFGFSEIAQTFTPTLSIINQDPRKIGKVAAEKLLDEILNKVSNQENNIVIEEEFIWNDSIIRKK